jgi:hypothetical protein
VSDGELRDVLVQLDNDDKATANHSGILEVADSWPWIKDKERARTTILQRAVTDEDDSEAAL